MSTSLIKLIPQVIQIEENLVRLYNNVVAIEGQYNKQLKSAAMVLARQMKDHADYYKNLQETLVHDDLMVDDAIGAFINEKLVNFRKETKKTEIKELSELYAFTLDVQKRSIVMIGEFRTKELPEVMGHILDGLEENQKKSMAIIENIMTSEAAKKEKVE